MNVASLLARPLLAGVVVVLLVPSAPAFARVAAGEDPVDVAAAEAFADAALDYTRAGYVAARETERLYKIMKPERCVFAPGLIPARWTLSALGALIEADLAAEPSQRGERAIQLMFSAIATPVAGPMVAATEQLVASLESVDVRDPTLRTARAAWRNIAWANRMISRAPEDVCRQLWTWARMGRVGLPLPGVDLRGFVEAFVMDYSNQLDRAAERLRELGQGLRRAERITAGWALKPGLKQVRRWEKRADVYREARDEKRNEMRRETARAAAFLAR